eukprot:scaffold4441_cov66-Phaeocystis_antarctica.AAC.12
MVRHHGVTALDHARVGGEVEDALHHHPRRRRHVAHHEQPTLAIRLHDHLHQSLALVEHLLVTGGQHDRGRGELVLWKLAAMIVLHRLVGCEHAAQDCEHAQRSGKARQNAREHVRARQRSA